MPGQKIDKPLAKDGTVLTHEFLASYSLSNFVIDSLVPVLYWDGNSYVFSIPYFLRSL